MLFNIAIKYSLWTQPPQTFTDSLSYIVPAINMLDGRGYGSQENGYRTPVYPFFIAAILAPFDHRDLASCREARVPACLGDIQSEPNADANLRAIVIAQIILGALTIPLVYFWGYHVARNVWVAALCALTIPLDLSTGYWEISILTEALTTFLLMLAVVLMIVAAKRGRLREYIALGLVLAALALCHPTFLLYAIVPAAFTVFGRSRTAATKQSPRYLSLVTRHLSPVFVLAIPALIIFAWSARNYFTDGFFTPSTLTGYNLTQMVGAFMEQAPAPYRDLAEIYVDTRAERVAARGNHSGTIFYAYPEMLAARKTTWSGLSRILTDLSLQLIAQNPRGYLRTVWESFAQFWKFGLGRQNSQLPITFDLVKWFFDSRVQQTFMLLFFVSPIALVLARSPHQDVTWIWFAIATVWFAAIFSSAFNYGDNERYRVPVARLQYSAIILTVDLSLRAQRGNLRVVWGLLRRKERSSQ